MTRAYFARLLPLIVKLSTRNRHTHMLMRYYWDTIESCVPPEAILDALRRCGFADAQRHVVGGCFSEYLGVKRARAL